MYLCIYLIFAGTCEMPAQLILIPLVAFKTEESADIIS